MATYSLSSFILLILLATTSGVITIILKITLLIYYAVMRVYCKTPIALKMWYITAPEKITMTVMFLKMLIQYDLPTKKTPNNIHECSA